ncbi:MULTISPECIES: Imm21 family immunity protein [unclassified Kitasatospora]|uniref:Imm21 family immunity protein n=1 Tax=unclassified Kitasatospora TaxID=2633591 RepID=UPI00070B6ADD|nr:MULTISPECIES: Imm21 family immunity protein [unclassified Kitasatospora]KQV13479.1 hypothetical protein ASC99_33845 [Kitasatospora sp. Root107]KRB69782.1 hypothetical protein ASE03_26515 [Kitasatospora sp. Root187]
MSDSQNSTTAVSEPVWVRSMGGPLIAVPASVVQLWGGCTEGGVILGDSGVPDDYDRACEVEGEAGLIHVGSKSALVLGDEPATTCFLPERRLFLRWRAADSFEELLEAAEAVLADPETAWVDCGLWETDGPAILMDSAEAGVDLGREYPSGGGQPDEAAVPVEPGRWRVRAFQKTGDYPWVSVVQLDADDQRDGAAAT